jgi:hypothetical protein
LQGAQGGFGVAAEVATSPKRSTGPAQKPARNTSALDALGDHAA